MICREAERVKGEVTGNVGKAVSHSSSDLYFHQLESSQQTLDYLCQQLCFGAGLYL
jgi:hypothetical protein